MKASSLHDLKTLSIASLQDTFSTRYHSKDFSVARSEYLRVRVQIIALFFTLLTPLWAVMDHLALPQNTQHEVFLIRVLMFVGLVAILLASRLKRSSRGSLQLSTAIFILPSLFYASVLVYLPNDGHYSLIGYSFIPYLLTATLGIFPFTLLESFCIGLGLLILQFCSGFVDGSVFSPRAMQDLWLLAALLVIAMTTNHFQLGLLLRLYRQATHDPLTGLLNRSALTRHIEQHSPQELAPPVAVMMLDLDHFKQINDTHGHSVGDRALKHFAQLLKKESKQHDIICRYGGEEFLLLSGPCPLPTAIEQAERIRSACQQLPLSNLEGDSVPLSVSIGLSMLRPGEHLNDALQRADERLYQAKRAGRNCVIAPLATEIQ